MGARLLPVLAAPWLLHRIPYRSCVKDLKFEGVWVSLALFHVTGLVVSEERQRIKQSGAMYSGPVYF